jgi:anthranilate synthase component 1
VILPTTDKAGPSSAPVWPALAEARELFQRGDLVPVYSTRLADLETPVAVYLKLRQLGGASFLLESVEGEEQIGRYSFIGANPASVVTLRGSSATLMRGGKSVEHRVPAADPLAIVREETRRALAVPVPGLPRFTGGAVGFMGYDLVRHVERLPETARNELDIPDAIFLLVDTLVIFDHFRHRLHVLSNARNLGDPPRAYADALHRIEMVAGVLARPVPPMPETAALPAGPMQSNVTRAQFEANVTQAKQHIAAGDAFQIVLSQRFSRQTGAPALAIYRALRAVNPSPYMFLFEFGQMADGKPLSLVGASPEMMVRLEDAEATVRPIAGTHRRGASAAEDEQFAAQLCADPKERAEHVMLVDLARNDLGRVCAYGTVKVTRLMYVERYSHVMHIVSQVQGRVRNGMDAFDLLKATFPAGTLSGAPKVRAMQIIEALEGVRRGPYGGAVGYFGYDGSMDTCITIRAVTKHGDIAHIQAGAGIVADSDPAREYEETINKARGMDQALRDAEAGLL